MTVRIRLLLAACVLLPAATASAAAPSCYPRWSTAPALTRGSTLACDDGDASCDLGSDPHSCTFRVGMCFNVDDPTQAACTLSAVTSASLIGRARKRGVDPLGAANHDALYAALSGLGADVVGTCVNAGPARGSVCETNVECDTATGLADGDCERRATFTPPLQGIGRCTSAAEVKVPLRARGARWARGARRVKVRVKGGRGFRSLRLVCNPAPAAEPGYDLPEQSSVTPAAYVPSVEQLTVASLSVQGTHGAALQIGHPVVMRAELDVQAEPFQSTLWYGLQNGDGEFCVVDHVALDHLAAVFDLATRANLAAVTENEGASQPSLTDCSASRFCAVAGEQCIAFRRQVATESVAYDPNDGDPNDRLPHEQPEGMPPTTVGTRIETSHLCATHAWAAAEVARRQTAPTQVTPADLAGTVEQRHLVGATGALPASCAALVGASDVSAWIAFDPEGQTRFVARPEYELPELPEDGALDPATQQANQDMAAYAQRLPTTVPVPEVEADGGLNVDVRSMTTGSSVMLVNVDDKPGGDIHVGAEYSLDGTPTPEQAAALPGAELRFGFTIRPTGDPRDGCVPTEAITLDPMPLLVVRPTEDFGFTHVAEERVTNLRLGASHDRSFPVYVPPDVRERLYGEDWGCWDQFEVRGCMTTTLSQETTDDDCATTGVVVLRNRPPDGAVIEEPPVPEEELAGARAARAVAAIGAPGCDDSLFQQYAENMKKFYELQNGVQITDYYTYDFARWLWGTLTPGTAGDGLSYITNAERQKAYFAHVKEYLEQCEILGGSGCWNVWAFKNSPWMIDIRDYQTKLLPYFWNAYGRSGAENYLKFKNDPQGHTRGMFNYECAGIASGSICSQINYDLALVPELARNIRNVLAARRPSDPLAAKISPYGAHRCLDRGYPALQRVSIDANGKPTAIPDDDAFFTQYLNQMCEKGRYKAEADRIWSQIQSSCTYIARPFPDSGSTVTRGTLVADLYKSYDTGFKAGLKGVVEGGILNDYAIQTTTGQFKLVFGTQGRVYLQSDPTNSIVGGWLDVYDIFKVWMLGNFYSDVLSSNVEAGFHVLTHDIWKISYKLPSGEFALPEPPELSKEKEKCKYLWKPPMPFRIELCGAVGGKAGIEVEAKVLKTGIDGVDPNKADWPGIEGVITPGVAITNQGRAGIDVFVASAGIAVVIDPTIGVYIPVTVGAKWKLALTAPRQLDFTMAPYVKVALELRALGGELNGYTRWKIGNTEETLYPIVDWDPLDIGNLLGADWTLVQHSWDVSGRRNF